MITNSIEVLLELSDVSGWDIISTGGTLRENYLALVGPKATNVIESFNADKVILSCKGMDMEKGLTDSNELVAEVKQVMLKSAGTRILAADHTKFNKIAFSKICSLSDIDMVVTDIRPSDEWMRYFEEKGIECLYGKETDEDHSICE